MTDNPYYRLLALLRRQSGAQMPLFALAGVELQDDGRVLLRADGEEVTLAERAAGLTFGAAQDGARLLCLRLDGGLIGLCLLE